MNAQEIKEAVEAGKRVFWCQYHYEVIKDSTGEFLIKHTNGSCIGLTHRDEVTLNGKPEEFIVLSDLEIQLAEVDIEISNQHKILKDLEQVRAQIKATLSATSAMKAKQAEDLKRSEEKERNAIKALKDKYGYKFFCAPMSEFRGDKKQRGLWLSGEDLATDPETGERLLDYYVHGSNENYDFGILKSFIAFVNSLGFSLDWYDCGTVTAYEDN